MLHGRVHIFPTCIEVFGVEVVDPPGEEQIHSEVGRPQLGFSHETQEDFTALKAKKRSPRCRLTYAVADLVKQPQLLASSSCLQ